jgi:L-malate glycosyltransferase
MGLQGGLQRADFVKVLHLDNEKDWGGGERQVLLLAAELRQRGLISAIGCRPGRRLAEWAIAEGIPTRAISGNSFRAVFDLVRAAKGFDIIHCHTGRAHSLAMVAAPFCRKPMVVTRRIDRKPHHSWFDDLKYRRAAHVVCISKYIARQLEDWGVVPEKLTVVYSAVPVSPFVEQPRLDQLGLNLPAGKRIVGNIGSLVGYKDHATLLRAAASIATKRDDVIFLILGEGLLRRQLMRMTRQLNLDGRVYFAGFVPQAERWLPVFDLLAVSSRQEGLGSIVLDAFAAGIPVVATAAGGLPELVRPGETGLRVEVGDADGLASAITSLLDNSDLALQLSATARAWVQKECSVERMAECYREVYRQALAG